MAQGHNSHSMAWSVGSQPLVVDFTAGCLVEDAGLLVRQLDVSLGVLSHLACRLPIPVLRATSTTASNPFSSSSSISSSLATPTATTPTTRAAMPSSRALLACVRDGSPSRCPRTPQSGDADEWGLQLL